jgi:alpha-tubulin suppressor-like RCC1 family protein
MPQWKQFSGQWTVTQAAQAKGAGTWPGIPGAPTIGTATAGNGEASVAFTAPANPGYPATITQYTVTSSPGGITASGSASPITVTGLTNGTEYTFTVTATNDTGTGPASAESNAVTPVAEGGLWAVGNNDGGQLGINQLGAVVSSPVQVGSLTTWSQVSMSAQFYGSFAIKTDGTMWAWGDNDNGKLGVNSQINKSSPTQIGSLTTWQQVAAMADGGYAIKNDGTLWSWGRNLYGSVGDNTGIQRSSPVQIGSDTDWAYIGNGGKEYAAFAVKTDGTLWTWGRDGYGECMQNTAGSLVRRSSPTQVGALTNWAKVENYSATYAVKTDGTLWVAGPNNNGGLGTNNRTFYSSPVQVGALTNWSFGIGGYASAAIKTDGTIWTVGINTQGALGTNTVYSYRSSPVQVGSSTTWSTFSLGEQNVAAINDGALYVWGRNNAGQLGLNDLINRSSPVQVGSSTEWFTVWAQPEGWLSIGPTS